VLRFDAHSGAYVDTFIADDAGGLHGPRGMIFRNPGALLVVNQNVDQDVPGEVLRYNGRTGEFLRATVPATDPEAPFAPRGMVLNKNTLYVADLVESDTADNGQILRYDVNSGRFLGELTPSASFAGQFNPRGVVFGPDGMLYVSVFETTNPVAGHVLRFNPKTGTSDVIATNDGDGIDEPGELKDLHRPEGLTFGPDGRLYVTSFRADASDNDKILALNVSSGTPVTTAAKIELDQVGQPRAFAQAILFGPSGRLYVPITGNGPDTGSVRVYDVNSGQFTVLVPPAADGGPLASPWYLTFGQTDPATLAYAPKPQLKEASILTVPAAVARTPHSPATKDPSSNQVAAMPRTLALNADDLMWTVDVTGSKVDQPVRPSPTRDPVPAKELMLLIEGFGKPLNVL
jgi:hypothetical protein